MLTPAPAPDDAHRPALSGLLAYNRRACRCAMVVPSLLRGAERPLASLPSRRLMPSARSQKASLLTFHPTVQEGSACGSNARLAVDQAADGACPESSDLNTAALARRHPSTMIRCRTPKERPLSGSDGYRCADHPHPTAGSHRPTASRLAAEKSPAAAFCTTL